MDQAIMSKSDETPANTTATLKKAEGNANAAFLLWRIAYWCTRKKGGVMYEGRVWSYRSQKQWIEQEAGLCERTGKRAWARLVEGDFIMTEMRLDYRRQPVYARPGRSMAFGLSACGHMAAC
jgi:hypothetical protein